MVGATMPGCSVHGHPISLPYFTDLSQVTAKTHATLNKRAPLPKSNRDRRQGSALTAAAETVLT
jgi:hypothetical protein